MWALTKNLWDIASQLREGNLVSLDYQAQIFRPKFAAIIALAQRELGMRPIEEA